MNNIFDFAKNEQNKFCDEIEKTSKIEYYDIQYAAERNIQECSFVGNCPTWLFGTCMLLPPSQVLSRGRNQQVDLSPSKKRRRNF